jgi:hypothetical protein
MNFYKLGQIGFDSYYPPAVRSMMDNWHNFFFAAYDPGGFTSLDKPPVGFWLQVLSAKIFGFTPVSVLWALRRGPGVVVDRPSKRGLRWVRKKRSAVERLMAKQLTALFFREMQVSLSFQQRHQAGQRRQEPFGTYVMCRLPGQKEALLHRWTVLGQTMALDALLTKLPMVEQRNGILASVARPFHTRVQQERFLGRGRLLVARSQMPEQRAPGLKAR